MKNFRDVILRPIITEKSMKLMEEENKYTFEVAKGSNKTEVKIAVANIFNVTVEAVNILNVRPKDKRVGKFAGKTRAVRKAIVKLAKDQTIELFDQGE